MGKTLSLPPPPPSSPDDDIVIHHEALKCPKQCRSHDRRVIKSGERAVLLVVVVAVLCAV